MQETYCYIFAIKTSVTSIQAHSAQALSEINHSRSASTLNPSKKSLQFVTPKINPTHKFSYPKPLNFYPQKQKNIGLAQFF